MEIPNGEGEDKPEEQGVKAEDDPSPSPVSHFIKLYNSDVANIFNSVRQTFFQILSRKG